MLYMVTSPPLGTDYIGHCLLSHKEKCAGCNVS